MSDLISIAADASRGALGRTSHARWPGVLRFGWLAGLLLMAAGAQAQSGTAASTSAFQAPRLQGRVNDYANLLSPDQQEALEQKLRAHQLATQQSFALLTVPSLQGLPIETYGIKLGEAWKLGTQKEDEGLILIIAPNERRSRVEVGYGLEGKIPDAVGARVLREVLEPAFKQEAYAEGINAAFNELIRAGGGNPEASQARHARRTRPSSSVSLLMPLLLPLILFFLFSGGGRGGGRRRGGGFLPGLFLGSGFGGGGGWGGGGGGGWGGGGGGGGGDDFRGGGGGFGGGGASGSW